MYRSGRRPALPAGALRAARDVPRAGSGGPGAGSGGPGAGSGGPGAANGGPGIRNGAAGGLARPVVAGVLTALTGFVSSFAVVLAGLRQVGASPGQAASGLLALCLAQGLGTIWLSRRHRVPITLAWSTPGAALLVGVHTLHGGWPAALGAFLVVAALILLTGAWPRLGALVAAIPTPIAQAMLAGALVSVCLVPVHAITGHPGFVAPIVLAWVIMPGLAPRWAVPAAFVVAIIVAAGYLIDGHPLSAALAPHVSLTRPTFSPSALLGVALPLYVVTMAAQNVPGVAVLRSYGFAVPWRETMAVTGLGTALAAPAGGHAVNLAAITAALAASPEADPRPQRRWIASQVAGWCYVLLAPLSPLVVAVMSAMPDGVLESVAGLALLPTLAASLAAAIGGSGRREPAVVAFVVGVSGISPLSISAPFWALAAGLATALVIGAAGRLHRESDRGHG